MVHPSYNDVICATHLSVSLARMILDRTTTALDDAAQRLSRYFLALTGIGTHPSASSSDRDRALSAFPIRSYRALLAQFCGSCPTLGP